MYGEMLVPTRMEKQRNTGERRLVLTEETINIQTVKG
jgi:hypothetical protein